MRIYEQGFYVLAYLPDNSERIWIEFYQFVPRKHWIGEGDLL